MRIAGLRDRFLRALVIFGISLLVITEVLSWFHRLERGPLLLCWSAIACIAAVRAVRNFAIPTVRFDPVVLLCFLSCIAILTLTAVTAAYSPPNSADAMAYHMPRVIYWAEASSVRFFPAAYLAQIMLQPMAEYMMLHTFLLSGGDHFINFVQWFASLASIVGVSAVAAEFGAGARGQALAAVFCATLRPGILASSGAKNDYVLAMWLVAAVYFALRFAKTLRARDAAFLGCSLGLALLTKATAYLIAAWLLIAILVRHKRVVSGAVLAWACAAAVNTPHYLRNYALSGSIMGFDSAQADGVYRWRNDRFGWKPTVSNALRNISEQLGGRSDNWNRGVYSFVVGAHQLLGIDVNDPATTWRYAVFTPPTNANHEANAPGGLHLAILFAIGWVLVWRALHGRDRERAFYALALACGFVALCGYLKWQPYFTRLILPLFVLGAPLVAIIRPAWLQVTLCVILLSNARTAVLQNWVRPLEGPRSVLRTPRDIQFLADMKQFDVKDSYTAAVSLLSGSGCGTIGIDSTNFQLEYPLQALLREVNPRAVFVHTGVENASQHYPQPITAAPCAVVCLNCVGDAKRLSLYSRFRTSAIAGKFVVFLE